MPGTLTIADLKRLIGRPAHVINHAISRFGPEPAGRVGIIRFWNEADLPAIVASVDKTNANRQKRKAVAK
jgi:hypothetical protein